MGDGIVKLFAEVHCYRCSEPMLGLAPKGTAKTLTKYGWKRQSRRWHCAACNGIAEAELRRARQP